MLGSSSRRAVLLDCVAAIGIAGPLVLLLDTLDERPVWFTLMLLGVIVVSVLAWVVWRTFARLERFATILFALCGVGSLVFGEGPLAYGAAWVACLMLAHTFNGKSALWYAATLCAIVMALHIAVRSPWDVTLLEVVATAVMTGIGAAFALVLHDAERVEREREVLHRERAETLAHLEDANSELQRRLGSEQDLVLAEERERAARELHDGLGHRLTAIGLSLEFADRMRERDPERSRHELKSARSGVSEALDAMRRTVRAMHPVELGELRGTAAFAAIADAFRSTGVDIRVTVDGDKELSHEHSLVLLRFIQEGLTNVVRHAEANRVEVQVGVNPSGVETSIEDFGEAPGSVNAEGFGLRSLRARAEQLGGSFDAHPTEHGFRLRLALPMDADVDVVAEEATAA